MISAVIFDMDGVLIDSEPLWIIMEEQFFRAHGWTVTPEYRKKIMGLLQPEVIELLRREYGLVGTTEEIMAERMRSLLAIYETRLELMVGARSLLERLLASHLRLGLATSTADPIVQFVLLVST